MSFQLSPFTVFIFLGVVQGTFLSLFFLIGGNRRALQNRLLGFALLALTLLSLEIFLNETGLMLQVLWLMEFSEPLNFTIGPLFYLYARARLTGDVGRRGYLHFLPFALYLAYFMFYALQGMDFKYDEYVRNYAPALPHDNVASLRFSSDPLGLHGRVNELTVPHLIGYIIASAVFLHRTFEVKSLSLFSMSDRNLNWVRLLLLQGTAMTLTYIFVKLFFEHNAGEYFIATCIALVIYSVSFSVVRSSLFFAAANEHSDNAAQIDRPEGVMRPQEVAKKYAKSALTEDVKTEILEKLGRVMTTEKPYTNPSLSLADLAEKIAVTPHHLSQAINERLEQNFFEYISLYRVEEAKRILADTAQKNLRIEDIAERSGYYSKSAFNTAFKKHTNQTPSQFRRAG